MQSQFSGNFMWFKRLAKQPTTRASQPGLHSPNMVKASLLQTYKHWIRITNININQRIALAQFYLWSFGIIDYLFN